MKQADTKKITTDFFKLLESLNDKQWELKVNKEWSVKNVVAHLVGWEYESSYQLAISWEKKKKPWFLETDDYYTFNRVSLNRFGKLPPQELLAEWKKWQQTLEEEIKDIGEGKLRAQPELFSWVFDEGSDNHYLHHYKQIQKILINQSTK